MKKLFILAFVFLSYVETSCKKDDTEPAQEIKTNNPLTTEFDKRINDILTPYAKLSSNASVSIGVFKDNQTMYYGYGETKKGNNTIPNSETIYEIGSITKTFTALLMIDFLQSNSLSIEDPINNYLPSDIPLLQHNSNPIRIKHLLNHTSGLPRLPDDFETGMDPNNPYKHYDSTKVFNYLKNFTLQTDPGLTWEYSNLGAGISGLILERQNHKSYEDLLIEKICTLLGLSKTKISLNSNDSSNYAVGYNTYGFETHYWDDLNAFKGAGAIKSNAKDLISYGKTILNHESSLLKTQIDSCLNVTYENNDLRMASGWLNLKFNGYECIFHDGGTGGFNSYIVINKEKNIVFVILFNNTPSSKTENCFFELVEEVIK
jgi:CubicO group peptidase (beta-lactamase class C family)